MKTNIALLFAVVLVMGTAGGALAAKGKPARPAVPAKPARPAVPAKPAPAKGFDAQVAKLGITCAKTPVQLKGTFGSAGSGFMAMTVAKATGKATPLVGKQVSIRTVPATKIVKQGPTTLSHLKAGQKLDVLAMTCDQGLVARTITASSGK
jgi:hypothetical protein